MNLNPSHDKFEWLSYGMNYFLESFVFEKAINTIIESIPFFP